MRYSACIFLAVTENPALGIPIVFVLAKKHFKT